MIRENITATIGGSYDLDGEIIVPSDVLTSTPQEDKGDLTTNLNFVLKLVDAEKKISVNTYADVEFTLGDKTYTASMKAYNRAGSIIALQYAGELTAEDAPDPEPETHTLEFDSANYNTSYDIYTGEKSQARVNVLYDGSSIHLTSSMFSGLVYNKIEPIVSAGGIFKAKDALPEVSAGATYVDNVTVTYEGLTASCTVTLTVTDSEPAPEP